MLESIFKSFGATYITSVSWLCVSAFVSSVLSLGFLSFYVAVIGLMYIWYKYSVTVEDERDDDVVLGLIDHDEF